MSFKVNGGTYTLKKDNKSPGFLFGGYEDAVATFTDVTINSEYRQPISAMRQEVSLNNCKINVNALNGESGWLSSVVSVSNKGTVTVNGGKYISKGFGLYVYNSGKKIILKGGEVKGDAKAVKIDANKTISEVVIEDGVVV